MSQNRQYLCTVIIQFKWLYVQSNRYRTPPSIGNNVLRKKTLQSCHNSLNFKVMHKLLCLDDIFVWFLFLSVYSNAENAKLWNLFNGFVILQQICFPLNSDIHLKLMCVLILTKCTQCTERLFSELCK